MVDKSLRYSMKPLNESIRERVYLALKNWRRADQESNTLSDLQLVYNVQSDKRQSARQATNLILFNSIKALGEVYEQEARFLENRFMKGVSIQQLCHMLNIAESSVYRMQKDAIERLANIIERQEEGALAEHKAQLYRRLESATYSNLVGIDPIVSSLLPQVASPEPPWIITIKGIGGSGKTALAHKIMTEVIEQGLFKEIGWISARQRYMYLGGSMEEVMEPALTTHALVARLVDQLMPEYDFAELSTEQRLCMLQSRLKDSPHLIVIDSLETLVDAETLIPLLQTMAGPTRFIITSRTSVKSQTSIFSYSLPELSRDNALMLIRQEARLSNLPVLAEASDDEIDPIYDVVGGNPLALRLIVSQQHVYPLDEILNGLKTARNTASQNLYRYIYRQIWENLGERSRSVLIAMTLIAPEGSDIYFLAAVSGLPADTINEEINLLIQLNLVDVSGNLHERRYSIQDLTRTFLYEDVMIWMRSEDL